MHLFQRLKRQAEHPQNLAHGLLLPLILQARLTAQLLQLRAQRRVFRPVQLPLRPAEQLRQPQHPVRVRFIGQLARRDEMIGKIIKPLEHQHEQIVHLAVAVGQIGIAPAAIDHLIHVDQHGRQRVMLDAHVLAPGQLFQLAAQVVHSFSNSAEMPAPVDNFRVEPQRGGHHHKAVDQHPQLHRQPIRLHRNQLQKNKLHTVCKVGLGAELGAEQVHQHKGYHQVQRQRPPEPPSRHEGRQADQHHQHRSARQLPGAEILPVTGTEHQR